MSRVTLKSDRPRRASINGVRNVLTVKGQDPNFHYRVVNDTGDRINQFEQLGYEVVTDANVKVGDRRIANPTAEGSPVKLSVGQGVQAYVMRIKKDWYEEDQAAKQQYVNELEAGMKSNAKQAADYGKLKIGE